jgi:hypothetical protein
MTTVDFWKRMSVMRVQGQGDGGKERYVFLSFDRLPAERLKRRRGATWGEEDKWQRCGVLADIPSEWLSEAQGSRRGIKKWILVGLVIVSSLLRMHSTAVMPENYRANAQLLIIIGAGVAYGVLATTNKPKSGIVEGKDA